MNRYAMLVAIICICVSTCTFFHFSRTKWVKADGVEFKKGAGIVFGMMNDLPQVGQITRIYVINGGTVLFRALLYKTSWIPHFRGYALHEDTHVPERLLCLSELLLYTAIHIRRPQALPSSKFYVIMYIDLNCYVLLLRWLL